MKKSYNFPAIRNTSVASRNQHIRGVKKKGKAASMFRQSQRYYQAQTAAKKKYIKSTKTFVTRFCCVHVS